LGVEIYVLSMDAVVRSSPGLSPAPVKMGDGVGARSGEPSRVRL